MHYSSNDSQVRLHLIDIIDIIYFCLENSRARKLMFIIRYDESMLYNVYINT